MRFLDGHRGPVRAVAFAADGRVVSGGADGRVRVWDAAGACERVIPTGVPVYAVAIASDGAVVAGGRPESPVRRGRVNLFDPAGAPAGQFHWPAAEPNNWRFTPSTRSLAFTADGAFVLAAWLRLGGGRILTGAGACWWRQDRTAAGVFADPAAAVVAAGPTSAVVAVTRERAVDVHEVPDADPVQCHRFPRAARRATGLAVLPGGGIAVALGGRLAVAALPPRAVQTGERAIAALAVTPDGRSALVGGSGGVVERFDLATLERLAAYDFGVGKVHGLAFAPDGHTFAVAGQGGLIVCDAD